MKKGKLSSTWYVAITIALSVVFVISFSLLFIVNRMDTLFLNEVSTSNDEIVSSETYQLESTIFEQINIIKSIEAAHQNVIDGESILERSFYTTILSQNEYIASIEIIGEDGIIDYSSREYDNREGASVSNNDLFQGVSDTNPLYIGSLIYDASIEKLALEVAYSGDNVVIFSRISIDCFHDFGDKFTNSFAHKEIMILDKNGIYLYDSANSNHLIQNRYGDMDEILLLSESNEYIFEINGKESIVSSSEFFVNDWHMVIYEDVESSLSLNRRTISHFIWTMIGVIAILTAIYITFNLLLARRLNDLVLKFKKVKERDFELVNEESMFREVDELRISYNDMVTELDYFIKRLQNMAFYDSLTGIPSKLKAKEDFQSKYDNWSSNTVFAYIDIIRFRVINDNYGYTIGDESLIQIANVLRDEIEDIYRIEGDEFLAIINLEDIKDFDKVTKKLEKSLYEKVSILGNSYNFRLKYGVSIFGKDGTTFDELFKKSIIAAESVQNSVVSTYMYFDASYADQFERAAKIELNIREALDKNEFTTVYQPIIDVKTRKIRGFEALSRWQSEKLGRVNPDEFIPILESRKEVYRLDQTVLDNALRLVKFIYDEYGIKLVASVNISVETIMRDTFVSVVESSIKKFDIDPDMLELEITESAIIVDFDKVTSKMSYLRGIGVKFSEDDFGDSYSSLTYLSRLKIDTLKISKNFLSTMLSNVESRVLVQTILTLSKKLGFYTIVEGVEDEEIFELFKKYGCDFVQGYLFYKPMSDKNILELMKHADEETKNNET